MKAVVLNRDLQEKRSTYSGQPEKSFYHGFKSRESIAIVTVLSLVLAVSCSAQFFPAQRKCGLGGYPGGWGIPIGGVSGGYPGIWGIPIGGVSGGYPGIWGIPTSGGSGVSSSSSAASASSSGSSASGAGKSHSSAEAESKVINLPGKKVEISTTRTEKDTPTGRGRVGANTDSKASVSSRTGQSYSSAEAESKVINVPGEKVEISTTTTKKETPTGNVGGALRGVWGGLGGLGGFGGLGGVYPGRGGLGVWGGLGGLGRVYPGRVLGGGLGVWGGGLGGWGGCYPGLGGWGYPIPSSSSAAASAASAAGKRGSNIDFKGGRMYEREREREDQNGCKNLDQKTELSSNKSFPSSEIEDTAGARSYYAGADTFTGQFVAAET
uniref:Uncharacterized protein n=1 Tax=Timema bartmani TaxID=61472 RepID=A0A7R9F1B3_9NEOP|nr:unnamed protein product [Timema bartmani]